MSSNNCAVSFMRLKNDGNITYVQYGMLIKFKFIDFPWNKTFQKEMLNKVTATKVSWTNIARLKNQSTACQRFAEFFAAAMRRNNNTLYSGGAVRPEKFLSNGYPNWEDWKTHFGDIATANGLEDEQCRVALPNCPTSWALDELSAMPQIYKTRVDGQPAPTLQRMLGCFLDGRLSAFHDQTSSRHEFKAMVQGKCKSP